MNRPAVFFDRDNTLIACDGYLGDPDKVVLVDGAAAAVARVRQLGFSAVVFSNQSGVARGMFPEEAVHAVNHRLDDLLHEEDPQATIDRHDFCPFHPNAKVERYRVDSDLRKPKPGMIYQAAGVLGLDLKRSWVIGDAPRDIAAGQAAGLRTVLLKIASLPPSPATNEGAGAAPDFVASSLEEAVDYIERNRDAESPEAAADEGLAQEQLTSDSDSERSVAQAEPQPADAWTSTAGPTPTMPSVASSVSFPTDWSASASSTTGPGAGGSVSPPATSDRFMPSTARAEEPVKLTPHPKPIESTKPAAGKPEPSKPEGSKPVQGGFVVKPNQPAPIGITWGERMRLAKGGGAISSAAAAATPAMPQAQPPMSRTPPPQPQAQPPQPSIKPPAEEPPTAHPIAEEPAISPDDATAENAADDQRDPAQPTVEAQSDAEAAEAADDADAQEAAPPEPVVVAPATPEPIPEYPVKASSPAATDDDAGDDANEAAALTSAVEAERVSEVAPRDAYAEPDAPAAEAPAAEARRGVRREDLLEHAYDVPPDNEAAPVAIARRRREPVGGEARAADAGNAAPVGDLSRIEALLEQVLVEMRRREDLAAADFSASKLVAGITQVLALAALFYAYFTKDTSSFEPTLLVAIALQTLTISLLIMGRQK